MTDRSPAGMVAVRRHLGIAAPASRAEICHLIARETRGEINALWAALNGPVSGRPGKKEQARREARIEGMKWALTLALGLPSAGWQEAVDAFLEEFRQERLKRKEALRRE